MLNHQVNATEGSNAWLLVAVPGIFKLPAAFPATTEQVLI
jgi:hypothetical protein